MAVLKSYMTELPSIEAGYSGLQTYYGGTDVPVWVSPYKKWINADGNPASTKKLGATNERPTDIKEGTTYYDKNLKKQLVYVNGNWVDVVHSVYKEDRTQKAGWKRIASIPCEDKTNIYGAFSLYIGKYYKNTEPSTEILSINIGGSSLYTSLSATANGAAYVDAVRSVYNTNENKLYLEIKTEYAEIFNYAIFNIFSVIPTLESVTISNESLGSGESVIKTVYLNVPTQGTFAKRPTNGLYIGMQYFCTDKMTTEGAANGIMIYYKGSDVWVDALGRQITE
jgi:hypothetical protein